ncbi:MAG: 4Fe-4S binding protein [Oscillospiraceae bacterium]|nr:4Fe-4S binding protein [Oscillospiraceae bacterium]
MIYELLFSATGRTEKVLDIISGRWEGEKIRLDLSSPEFDGSRYNITAEDFCIFATSVFEGRIPAPALQNLKKLTTGGAKMLLVAVFGNRAVDDCLLEMKNEAERLGFVPVAAIEASVQHSIITKVEASRPDQGDIAELKAFADKVKQLMDEKIDGQLNVPGNYPYVEMGGVPLKPKGNKNCVNCGLCAAKCPVKAIDKTNPRLTDKNKCITCMRCAEICPVDARNFPGFMVGAVHLAMKSKFAGRKPNKLYIPE